MLKKTISLLTTAVFLLHIFSLDSFVYAQTKTTGDASGDIQQPIETSPDPILIETETSEVIDIKDPDVEIIVGNDGGEIDIIIVEKTPTPSPTPETVQPTDVPQAPTETVIKPTIAPTNTPVPLPTEQQYKPTNTPVPLPPTKAPTLPPKDIPTPTPKIFVPIEPTETIINPVEPTRTPSIVVIPTATPKLVAVTPTPTNTLDKIIKDLNPFNPTPSPGNTGIVLVTPTPTPFYIQATPTPTGTLEKIIKDIFTNPFGPTPTPVLKKTIPDVVLITPTPTPNPESPIETVQKAITDFFGITSEPDEEESLVIATQNVQKLAGSSAISDTTSFSPERKATEASVTIVNDYLDDYQLSVDADTEGNVVIERAGSSVKVGVPVVLDPQSRSFSVRTDNGDIPITYYPDTIKAKMEIQGVVTSDQDLKLGFRENDVVYIVEGCENEYFLALIPVCHPKRAIVSARSPEQIYEIQQSFLARVVDGLSI